MNHYLVIGIVAGACTALLNLAGYAGGMLGIGVLLVMISPMPIMIASLGWGSFSGIIAAATSGIVLSVIIGPLAGFLFFLLNSLPAWWLTHLLGLNRSNEETGSVEWYPLDRLLIWIVILSALATMAMFIPFGFSLEAFKDAISVMMQQVYDAQQMSGPNGEGLSLEGLINIVSKLAPSASAFMLVVSTTINLYLSAKIAQKSGRLARPWPNLHQVSVPPHGAYLLLLSLLGFFFFDGLIGIFSQIIATSFGSALLLVGLSVLHFITRNVSSRFALLWGTYFLLVVFLWPGIVLIMLGAAEVLTNIRARANGGNGPQEPKSGSD